MCDYFIDSFVYIRLIHIQWRTHIHPSLIRGTWLNHVWLIYIHQTAAGGVLPEGAVALPPDGLCCSVLQCVTGCCSVLQCFAVCGRQQLGGYCSKVLWPCLPTVCVTVRCSVLQCVAVRCNVAMCCRQRGWFSWPCLPTVCVAVCCSVLAVWQAAARRVLPEGAVALPPDGLWYSVCSVLQCVAVHSSVFAVCCSVLQCVVGRSRGDNARRHRAPAPRRSVLHVLHVL